MSNIVCELKNVQFTYPKSDKGVKDINIYVNEGSIVGLLGESGCGKSTLAKCIAGLLKVDSGELDCQKLGYIFQDNYAALNPKKTVEWLFKEVIRYNDKEALPKADLIIKEMLDEVELDETVLNHRPNELSGGQRQRVGIAMALLSNPKILIADEPVSALDVTVQKQVIKLLQKLNKEKNLAILFISHDIKVVRDLCGYIYILKDGKIVEEGDTEKIFDRPEEEYTRNLLDSSFLTK